MKKLFFMIIFCLMAGMLNAQDTIYRVDGSKQVGKIVEINPTQVKYIRADNPEGPVFRITKNTVAKIVYEDGSAISFQEIREPEHALFSEKTRDFAKRNIIAIDFFDPVFLRTVSVSYERLSKSGVWGYKIPLSLGIDNKHKQYRGYKLFSTGIALNFYPFDDIQHKYYLGISGAVGSRNSYSEYFDWINGIYKFEKDNVIFMAFAFNTGIQYNLTSRFLIALQLGIGFETPARPYYRTLFPFEFSICYTF